MKKALKILSVALTVVLIIGIFSCATSVFAAEVTEKDSVESTLEQYKSQVEYSENKSLYEIKEERDKFTKVFKNEDGTKTAIVSATPIHYETSKGWEDIDNTLIEETKVTGKIYKNKKNDFTVTIPQELSSSKKLKIEKGDFAISFELEGSDIFSKNKDIKGNKKNKNKKLSIEQNEIDTEFLDKTSGIVFENVGENTSVEYEVTSTGLKENIILNKKPEEQVIYKYKITAKKLDAQFNGDNSVTFKNADGQAVFEIPAPVMYDAKNNISNEIEVEFSGKNGKYTLIYKPSFKWLTSDLTYPVVIDPIIDTSDEELGIKDTIVDSSQPDENFNALSSLCTYKSASGEIQSFIDMSDGCIIKNGAKIKSVLLGLYYTTGFFEDNTITVAAYTVTSPWNASQVTYDTKPTTINYLIDRSDIKSNTTAGYLIFDVTEAYTLNQDTYGVCIRQRDNDEDEAMLYFASSETQIASQQPFFIIEYYEAQGVEEQFDYHAFDAGRAGTAYFNDFTEQVYIERDELGLSGINMPVQIKRYFNSGLGGTYAINHYALSGLASTYGFGWRTNYNQMIEYHNEIDSNETILYCNGEGQTIYFEKITTTTDSDTVITWKEKPDKFSNSEGYTLEIPDEYNGVEANSLQYVKIKDSSGQTYEFNSDGLLTKIITAETDSTKNITITYADNDYKIQKITDGVGREYRFTYTTYEEWLFPLLTSIQAYSPGGSPINVTHNGSNVPYKITYTYAFSNYLGVDGLPILSSATYPDGETVYYSVSDNLISLKNIDGYTVEFAFNDSNTIISEKVYNEKGVTNGGQLTITNENSYEKTYVDLIGTKITKQFDMYGRTINTKNNNDVTQSVARIYSDDYKAQGSVSYSFYNTVEQDLTGNETNLVTNSSFTTNLSGWTLSSSSIVTHNTSMDCETNNEIPGSLQIQGKQSSKRYAYQIINVENGVQGDEYRLDYFKNNGDYAHMVIDLALLSTVIIQARNNINGDEEWQNAALVEENPLNTNWQKYSYAFDIDFSYNEIKVILVHYYQYGSVYFDNINLVNTYKAPVIQNPDTETDDGNTGSNTIGCGCNGCTTINCPCTEHSDNCTLPTCNRGYNFENNSNGISFSITDGEKTMAMEQIVNGNYYSSQKDLNGIYTGYSYDQMNGQLEYMSDGKGNVTSFYYDAMSRLNKVHNNANGIIMETSYSYEDDRIKSISHNDFSYNYEYDDWGNQESVKVGEQNLVEYEYGDKEGDNPKYRDRLNKITYGNGDYTEYTYNTNGNIESIKAYSADGTLVADYVYGYVDGQLQTITSVTDNCTVKYTDKGWEYYTSQNAAGTPIYSKGFEADEDGNEISVEILGGMRYTENKGTVDSNSTEGITTTSSFKTPADKEYTLSSVTDYFGRTENKSFSYLLSQENGVNHSIKNNVEYVYRDYVDEEEPGKIFTTSQVSSYKTSFSEIVGSGDDSSATETVLNGNQYYYEYDQNGNITRISCADYTSGVLPTATEICSYVYDSVGQLIRENDAISGVTSVYVYDKGGNLVQRKNYEYTIGDLPEEPEDILNYTYDSVWKDKLTAFEDIQIQTDEMGNPLNFYTDGMNGEVTGTLEWNGRQLSAVTIDGDRCEYSYNADGLRTKAVFRDEETNEINSIYYYFWENGKMTGYCVTDEDGIISIILKIFFDNAGEQIGYEIYSADTENYLRFFFEKNLQGDITGVYNEEGQKLLTYCYDAWGNISPIYSNGNASIMAQTFFAAVYTPITYRGYIYDIYTGLYYLQSRYYNPVYGRFLNADSIIKTGEPLGANIFAYCGNNPVNYVDYGGYSSKNLIDMIVKLIILLVALDAAMKYLFNNIKFDKVSSLKQDWNGIYSIKMRYLTETDDKEWLTLEFGDYEAWKNSSTIYNNNTAMFLDAQAEVIYNEGLNVSMGLGTSGSKRTIIASDIVLGCEIIFFSIEYAPYRINFKKVWGKKGLDPDNELMYYVYRVTNDKRFNGSYAFSLVSGDWRVLN